MSGNDAKLRLDFDALFAAPPPEVAEDSVALISLRLSGAPYALRLEEVSGLHRDRKIVWVPGGAPTLKGLAGIRGKLVPIFDLAAILGHQGEEGRWVVLYGQEETMGFAFSVLEGYLTLPRTALARAEQSSILVTDVAKIGSIGYGIVSLPAVADTIRRNLRA